MKRWKLLPRSRIIPIACPARAIWHKHRTCPHQSWSFVPTASPSSSSQLTLSDLQVKAGFVSTSVVVVGVSPSTCVFSLHTVYFIILFLPVVVLIACRRPRTTTGDQRRNTERDHFQPRILIKFLNKILVKMSPILFANNLQF